MRAFSLHPATLAATCLLLLGGCGSVTFENPLSDDETTQVDERLVGYWEPIPESIDAPEPGPGDLWHHLVVGRLAEGSDRMEAVVLDVDSGVVKVTRIEIRPTRIGDKRYMSLINRDEVEKGYYVVRYDMPADNRIRLQLVDEDVFAKAVETGALKGKAPGAADGDEKPSRYPHVMATTAELRAWILAHADTCVAPKQVVFRRLVEPESSGSEGPDEEDDPEDEE